MQLDPDTHQMTAIVLAGDRTKADSLVDHSRVGAKAMIDIDGLPMVRRVLNALRASRVVDKICLAGPEASAVATDEPLASWVDRGEVQWRAPESSPSTSAYNAMRSLDPEEAVLLTTADHPLLTPEIVDAFGRQSLADDVDVTVGLAPHALVTEAYPGIRKTVLRFSDGDFCGCNLFAFITPEGRRAARFWRQIAQQRTKPLVVREEQRREGAVEAVARHAITPCRPSTAAMISAERTRSSGRWAAETETRNRLWLRLTAG